MIELKEDDVIERLSEKDDLNPFMQEAAPSVNRCETLFTVVICE